MVVEPEKQIGRFMDAGGDIINVHIEAATHVHRIVQEVHARDKKAGVCLNPGTPPPRSTPSSRTSTRSW